MSVANRWGTSSPSPRLRGEGLGVRGKGSDKVSAGASFPLSENGEPGADTKSATHVTSPRPMTNHRLFPPWPRGKRWEGESKTTPHNLKSCHKRPSPFQRTGNQVPTPTLYPCKVIATDDQLLPVSPLAKGETLGRGIVLSRKARCPSTSSSRYCVQRGFRLEQSFRESDRPKDPWP